MDEEELRKAVWENLTNGFEGGYVELLQWTPEEVAVDMQHYAGDMDVFSTAQLLPHIISWQEEQKIKKAELGG